MATKEDIKRILLLLSVLPNNALREDNLELAIEAYHLVLKDLDWQTLESAAAQHLGTATFFPTPGNLREAAMDVLLSAQGIPSAGEAWGSVLNARHIEDARYCSERLDIEHRTEGVIGDEYWYIIDEINTHEKECRICTPSRTVEDYSHPLVAEAVRRMGGYDNLFTDNPAADRARFMDEYKTILERERREVSRLPEVRAYIEGQRGGHEIDVSREFKRLTDKFTGKSDED